MNRLDVESPETRLGSRPLIAALLAIGCTIAAAQGPVYESKDKAGPVFSDQPSPGARPIDLPPPNVIEVPRTPQQPSAPAAAAKAAAPAYTSLAIAAPRNQDTIHSNTGEFDVSVTTVPALRAAAGDTIRVRLDGNLLPQSYRSPRLRVTAADWQGAARGDDGEHTLQVTIVDKAGAALIESAAVSFQVRRATAHRGR
jgi:hypothetical protein